MTLENLTLPHGRLPVNTAGGNLADGFVHGIGVVLEAVRQIRGGSPNPVPGARVSLLLRRTGCAAGGSRVVRLGRHALGGRSLPY